MSPARVTAIATGARPHGSMAAALSVNPEPGTERREEDDFAHRVALQARLGNALPCTLRLDANRKTWETQPENEVNPRKRIVYLVAGQSF